MGKRDRQQAVMVRLFLKIPAAVLLLLLCSQNLSAEGKERVAVLSFLPLGSDAGYTRIIRDRLEMSLYRNNSFTLLERDQIRRTFKARSLEPHNCRSRTCIRSMGTMLSARFVITGTLKKTGSSILKIQVHRMPSGRVLFSYVKTFISEEEQQKALSSLAAAVTRDILQYGDMPITINNEKKASPPPSEDPLEVPRKKRSPFPLSIGLEGAMILPTGHFHSLVNTGFGIHVTGETAPLGASRYYLLRHLFFGFKSGCQYFTGQVNSKDRALLVPVLAVTGFQLPLPSIFFLRFSLGGGVTIVTLSHKTGDGFDMPDNSSAQSSEATMDFFAGGGLKVFKGLNISAGYFYTMRFEASRPVHAMGMSISAVMNFEI